MRRALITGVAVAALTLPSAALAEGGQSPTKNASKVCKALRAQMGAELFRTTYGTNHNKRNAHGKCVSKHRSAVRGLIADAVSECKAELAAPESSVRPEGDKPGKSERRALRACVKQKLRALLAERRADFENAARECKTARKADPDAFREQYGSNRNKRNAFGKCVVQTVRENRTEAPAES